MSRALEAYQDAQRLPGIEVIGVDCHIGSQITDLHPFSEAVGKIQELVSLLREKGIDITHIDLGGGLGITQGIWCGVGEWNERVRMYPDPGTWEGHRRQCRYSCYQGALSQRRE